MTPFNKPFLTGKETDYITEAVKSGKISGDGMFTKKCYELLHARYGFTRALLTTSCTDALEMAAILLDIQPGDEVIVPSYTFVSTANAFALRGAKLRFADSYDWHPNIDPQSVAGLITERTKAIVPVHYAGMACQMDELTTIAKEKGIAIVEDAAQAIDSAFIRPDGSKSWLGTLGAMSAFSFHETKNVIAGEGGMLLVNDPQYMGRAEIIREKGTNRSAFFRGEVDKYNWVDIGSSFLPSDIIAAFLYAQFESIDSIQATRMQIWDRYHSRLEPLESAGKLKRPVVPAWSTNNGHMYYLVCQDVAERTALIAHLKQDAMMAVFHYISLHKSDFYRQHSADEASMLPNSDMFTDCLVRLPMFNELPLSRVDKICESIFRFYKG